ncbi:hypothetical protein A0H81_14045 [Grifola frondosa]|uniref:Uncharacterized protein n=1 Tax=Grifola frondosa TaxID=5627 RepID=A0A1C7LT58_GRIFR|nr:hypothetical protein A0H81_14045 [Grifola frondosa]
MLHAFHRDVDFEQWDAAHFKMALDFFLLYVNIGSAGLLATLTQVTRYGLLFPPVCRTYRHSTRPVSCARSRGCSARSTRRSAARPPAYVSSFLSRLMFDMVSPDTFSTRRATGSSTASAARRGRREHLRRYPAHSLRETHGYHHAGYVHSSYAPWLCLCATQPAQSDGRPTASVSLVQYMSRPDPDIHNVQFNHTMIRVKEPQ